MALQCTVCARNNNGKYSKHLILAPASSEQRHLPRPRDVNPMQTGDLWSAGMQVSCIVINLAPQPQHYTSTNTELGLQES